LKRPERRLVPPETKSTKGSKEKEHRSMTTAWKVESFHLRRVEENSKEGTMKDITS
jgi:hypothetical protein